MLPPRCARALPSIAVVLALQLSASAQCQEAKLNANDRTNLDNFASSIDVSGTTGIMGALNDDAGRQSGSAYIFTRQGTAWAQQAKLTASDAASGDLFGVDVAVSGDVAVVGAYLDDDAGTSSGSAYVFERSGNTWSETAKLTANDATFGANFGVAVSVSGDTIVVGAQTDPGSGGGTGAAYVFERQGTSWVQVQKLTGSSANPGAFFGQAVSIDGDAILVGAFLDDAIAPCSGSAFVFERQGTLWTETGALTAADGGLGDQLGSDVSISGTRALVGAFRDNRGFNNSGAAYVYEKQGTDWIETARLSASDEAEGDQFGIAVSLSGSRAVIGAYLDDTGGDNSGAAYLFELVGLTWNEVNEFRGNDTVANDHFGSAVGIDGDVVFVGAPDDADLGPSSGSAYVFSATCGAGEPGSPFCFGVGCPCGNDFPAGGCVNSSGTGATLSASGSTSVAADDLVLTTIGCPRNNTGLYFVGATTFAPILLGDGLACTGGVFRYFPGVVGSDGVFVQTTPVGSAFPGAISAGDTRHFQSWTRDVTCGPPPTPCTTPCGQNSNVSNGYSVVFTP